MSFLRPPGALWTTAARLEGISLTMGEPTWQRWRWMLRMMDGQPHRLSEAGRAFVRARLGLKPGTELPQTRPKEVYIVGGRHGGKSRTVGTVIIPALALFPGVPPPCTIIVAARSMDQTAQIFAYAREALNSIGGLVARDGAQIIRCTNGVIVERVTSSYKTVRSRVLAGAILDEIAHWKIEDESHYSDAEFVKAIRPALNTRDPGQEPGLLCGLSSPWQKAGTLWDNYETHWGKPPGDTLVMQGATWEMRPSVDRTFLEREREKDPLNYAVEYGADFRLAQYGFLSEEEVDACIDEGVHERPPEWGKVYSMFVDASSGTGRDPAAAAVGHWEGGKCIIDAIRFIEPPFDRALMVGRFSELAASYRIVKVIGDQWDGVMHSGAWRDKGYSYDPAPMNKTELYRTALPHIIERSVSLLDNEKLRKELLLLERVTANRRKEHIDHPPGKHDDVANVVAGLIAIGQPPSTQIVVAG